MTAERPTGVWRAKVTKVVGAQVWVRVPRLASKVDYGPCEMLDNPYTPSLHTALTALATAAAGSPAHTHGVLPSSHDHSLQTVPLSVGDRVIVAFLEGRQDDVVVLGRLP